MTPNSKGKPSTRHRILDAAEQLVTERGVRDLTLDAVAGKAGLSKGGLLYHFASKDQLIVGLVQRYTDEMSADFDRVVAEDTEPLGTPGRLTRAMLRGNRQIESDPDAARRYTRAFAVLLATIVHDPDLLEPIRAFGREWLGRLREDGLPPGRAQVIASAIDGMWLASMFGLRELDREHVREIYQDLERLATVPESEAVPK